MSKRRRITIGLIGLLVFSLLFPLRVGADDIPPRELAPTMHKTRCVPNQTVGDGIPTILDGGDGHYVVHPELAPILKREGGFCEIKALTSEYSEIRITSASPIMAMTEKVRHEKVKDITLTGRTIAIWIDKGADASKILITVQSVFLDLDPRIGGEKYNTPGSTYFPQTGQRISEKFLKAWETNGGLTQFGFPTSPEGLERLEDGKLYKIQYFERARFEHHPENAGTRYEVMLGQFGRRIHGKIDPNAERAKDHTCSYFQLTLDIGHNLCGSFNEYWVTHGGLAQFGFPITEEFEETLEDGKTYRVQYFERARFEHHPENPAPYNILLGQFGRRILADLANQRLTSAGNNK